MFGSKSILWITFAAFCVTTGSCKEFYQKTGDTVKMDCAAEGPMNEVEWKMNNHLVLFRDKSGRMRKAGLGNSDRARIEGTSLKISGLQHTDSGEFTCRSAKHMLYVASANANPSVVLHSSETKLSCDITGDFKGKFKWTTPKSQVQAQSKEVNVKATSEHSGSWKCTITNNQQEELITLEVILKVVGPLVTSENVKVSEGDSAMLPCSLSASSGLSITGGSWTRNSSGVHLVTLMRTESDVKWNKTNVNTDKVGFSDTKLSNYDVKLKKVKLDDAGVYVCSLKFDNGKSLSASLMLMVSRRDGPAPETGSKTSTLEKMWFGLPLWIWIGMLVILFVVVLVIVVAIVLLCYRKKRMKRKLKNSKRQPKNYCICDSARRQSGKSPGKSPGKRERPPPLPRHQYNSLNE
ncbi:CD4-2 molecule, tandem duplicate 2 isoform X1 [Tachysurus vachellii]|uniref:CD4-2 molecule, tandem duplicate 2 isoform X1 n=1 Tax=Tachysurus vachellii TaxID=175792 RepID=UPI00296ACDFE|nr:CD4-2 molecule, tandem duplicate 2 isoform X1 [Tachysurus vachellii]XP_060726632.1 CD4-2 molecule, tandem duplicate 2 isoform X1 [Tachysurus vachellii]